MVGQYNKERRKSPRLDKIIKMRYQRLENLSEKAPYQEGDLLDISGGGLRFIAPKPPEIDSQLVIVLEYPGWLSTQEENFSLPEANSDTGVLQALGRVLRVQASQAAPGKYEVGVQFSGELEGEDL